MVYDTVYGVLMSLFMSGGDESPQSTISFLVLCSLVELSTLFSTNTSLFVPFVVNNDV